MKRRFLSSIIVTLGALAVVFTGVVGAYAESELPLIIRVRGLGIITDVDSDPIPAVGGDAAVDNSVGAEIDFTWFFMDNIAAELVLGVAQHNVEARGTALGDVDLGDVWLIPPTLSLQYHFLPDATIRPYIGAGVNYTIFFEEDEGTVASDTSYDNSFGYAFGAGVDFQVTENFAFNIDLKKLYLDTEAEVTVPGAVLGAPAPATVKTDVDIDPWLLAFGIAYRF